MEAVLKVSNVGKRFKNGRGVQDVSLEIAGGEVFGLIGPNGAGKTTLLKLIAGLARPDRGRIELFGLDAATRFEQAMAGVGCIVETAHVYEKLTAYGQLRQAARFYPSLPDSRIDQALEQVGLSAYRHEKAGSFSLGMKQRLALAAALLSRPRLVVLDEPTNGLDVQGIAELRTAIRSLSAETGVAFLISSHLVHDLGLIAGRVGIMSEGRLIRTEAVDEGLWGESSLEQFSMAQIQSDREARLG
ncbi:ABC transporter ATP-binding protein [Cohnella hashimotonis]|uniref:ABC transporter ATP-binding protein n=1 Tax=Cohnella hashimotonis TaxID=2826895 RepID=A0ABT6TEH4_9BACL|nr:ABC transporter ATP-binding protein [Cohnella hashimotonis]MDI4645238.1 ABC transporter ATP-binding protein [Cohnella hashimotonis]